MQYTQTWLKRELKANKGRKQFMMVMQICAHSAQGQGLHKKLQWFYRVTVWNGNQVYGSSVKCCVSGEWQLWHHHMDQHLIGVKRGQTLQLPSAAETGRVQTPHRLTSFHQQKFKSNVATKIAQSIQGGGGGIHTANKVPELHPTESTSNEV